jgi:hypothetical protein
MSRGGCEIQRTKNGEERALNWMEGRIISSVRRCISLITIVEHESAERNLVSK